MSLLLLYRFYLQNWRDYIGLLVFLYFWHLFFFWIGQASFKWIQIDLIIKEVWYLVVLTYVSIINFLNSIRNNSINRLIYVFVLDCNLKCFVTCVCRCLSLVLNLFVFIEVFDATLILLKAALMLVKQWQYFIFVDRVILLLILILLPLIHRVNVDIIIIYKCYKQ